jgi:NAD(P)-dependent dehydrogenase (short-subunit alcohol dehydrogenase family)
LVGSARTVPGRLPNRRRRAACHGVGDRSSRRCLSASLTGATSATPGSARRSTYCSSARASDEAAAALGGLDIVVNNAGIDIADGGRNTHEFEIEVWDRMMALHALMQTIAAEYGPLGRSANCICPGVIETDMHREYVAGSADGEALNRELLRGTRSAASGGSTRLQPSPSRSARERRAF